MTIQPSILLWTLICFALMMLVLDRLLFRPMLSFMDARNEKIAAAAQKKEAYDRALRETEAELTARREQASQRAATLAKTEIVDAKHRAKSMIAKAEIDRETRVGLCKTEIAEHTDSLEISLASSVDTLAKAFVDKLVR